MNKQSTIYVAGHTGLVGSAICRALGQQGFEHIITKTHQELDLCDQGAVSQFFSEYKPEYVILAAAKVGGIFANNHYPGEFIAQNLMIQTNVIDAAKQHGVKRLLFLGSSCIYPRNCPQPIKESYLMTGPLESTNRPYAIAKIAGIEMCWAYNRQYNTQFLAVMPTNLYGPGDNYHLKNSHVIPALIKKMHLAKENNSQHVEIWGTGTPKREFLFSDDLADACLYLLRQEERQFQSLVSDVQEAPLVNIGCGQDITIAELAALVADVVGYQGEIIYNTDMPDGTPRKVLDVAKLSGLGWQATTSLPVGLKRAYRAFLADQCVERA